MNLFQTTSPHELMVSLSLGIPFLVPYFSKHLEKLALFGALRQVVSFYIHLFQNINSTDHVSEHNAFAIQPKAKNQRLLTNITKTETALLPFRSASAQEKLRTISIGPRVGHGHDSKSHVP